MARTNFISMLALGAAAALTLTGCSSAGSKGGGDSETAGFPEKDITLVVPWNPGGDGDLSARSLAKVMEGELGVNIIVENRPGANGSIGWQGVKDSKADGYTMTMGSFETAVLQFMDYDIKPTDFTFLGQATSAPGAMAVPANAPYDTIEEFVEYAKKNPGKLSYSSPGVGSVWDMPTHKLMAETGTEFSGVPFDGSAPSVQAVAAGHVDFALSTVSLLAPHVESGNLKFIAMTGEERHKDFPDVPTFKERGIDLVHASWVGVMVPEATPEENVKVLADAMTTAVESDAFVKAVEGAKLVPTVRPYPEMDKWVEGVAETNKPLFKQLDLGS